MLTFVQIIASGSCKFDRIYRGKGQYNKYNLLRKMSVHSRTTQRYRLNERPALLVVDYRSSLRDIVKFLVHTITLFPFHQVTLIQLNCRGNTQRCMKRPSICDLETRIETELSAMFHRPAVRSSLHDLIINHKISLFMQSFSFANYCLR